MSGLGNLIGLAGYVWEHGDRLLALLRSLPEGLRSASSGLVKAGDGAILVGKAFGGSSAEPPNAAELVGSVKHAVEGCAAQVQAVARELRAAAEALDRVRVPAVIPVKEQFDLRVFGLGKHELVTGITFSDQSPALFGGVAGGTGWQDDSMEAELGGQLARVSEDLGGMSLALDSAGDGLTSVGNSLREGGAALEPFSR